MRQHHPLGAAGRAGGIDQGRQVARVDRGSERLGLVSVGGGEPGAEGDDAAVRGVAGGRVRRDHAPQRRSDVARRRDRPPAVEGIDDQGDRAGVP